MGIPELRPAPRLKLDGAPADLSVAMTLFSLPFPASVLHSCLIGGLPLGQIMLLRPPGSTAGADCTAPCCGAMTVKPAELLISPNCKSLWLVVGVMFPILIVPEGEDDATHNGVLLTPSACSMAVLSTGQRLNGAQSPLRLTDE